MKNGPGDIIGIWTEEGGLYLAALDIALARRHLKPELIHHSDRGSQFTADDYQATLRSKHVHISMSKKGKPLDNAMMESFFSTLRVELTELQHFHIRAEARTVVSQKRARAGPLGNLLGAQ